MGNIRILAEHEARKIAAGEVVERPASVVKELVENALDAGAREITIVVRDGGKSFISVTDDGAGMSPEDARLSLEHHATSKLVSVDELSAVSTFGFRGEALSTIGAVSRMRLITRRTEDSIAYAITTDAGTIIEEGPCVANRGTTVIVEDLFAYVPARRKFLKQRDTEWRTIYQLIMAYASLYPAIRWNAQHDGVSVIVAHSCTTLHERVQTLVDHDMHAALIPVSYRRGQISIEGVITNHQYERYDRRSLFCFVNRRWVKNNQLSKAIMGGYAGVLPPQKYPYALISLTVPLDQVDINIHPRKEEVWFLHPYLITTAIEEAVHSALTAYVTPAALEQHSYQRSDLLAADRTISQEPLCSTQHTAPIPVPRFATPLWTEERRLQQVLDHRPHNDAERVTQSGPLAMQEVSVDTPQLLVQQQHGDSAAPQYTYIGQLGNLYLLLETTDGLVIVDQHAAHESVIYAQLQDTQSSSLIIMHTIPQESVYTAQEYAYGAKIGSQLYELGIALEFNAPDMIRVLGTAPYYQRLDIPSFIKELAATALDNDGTAQPTVLNLHHRVKHTLAARIACKSAVKAGDILSAVEVENLLNDFWKTKSRLTCPHGRPTLWRIDYRDLARFFKRIT